VIRRIRGEGAPGGAEQSAIESVDDLEAGEGATFSSQDGALKLVRCLAKPKSQQR
jgi:hypothetical protein